MLTSSEMKDGFKCSLPQPPELAVDTQARPRVGDAADAVCSGRRDDGAHAGCHCHADILHVHTCVSTADAGPCGAQGGRHRGSVGPAPSQSSCAPPSASRVSAHPSLLALGAFLLTAPAQYVFKGLPFRLQLSFCICLLPCVFLVTWHLGLSTVPEVYPRGRGCRECVRLCSLSL